jgi:hypothetical protein
MPMSPAKTRRPRPTRAQVLGQLNDLLDLAAWLELHVDDWTGPLGSSDGPGQRGNHSDPTAAAAVNPDRETLDLVDRTQQFLVAVVTVEDDILRLKAFHAALVPLTADQARNAKTPDQRPGVGQCAACGVWVSGVDPDRLKAGYCQRDYQRWVREDRPDRVEFQGRVHAEEPARAS